MGEKVGKPMHFQPQPLRSWGYSPGVGGLSQRPSHAPWPAAIAESEASPTDLPESVSGLEDPREAGWAPREVALWAWRLPSTLLSQGQQQVCDPPPASTGRPGWRPSIRPAGQAEPPGA